MEGFKAILGGDKGRERLKEICLIRPVRTGRRGADGERKDRSQKWKMDQLDRRNQSSVLRRHGNLM